MTWSVDSTNNIITLTDTETNFNGLSDDLGFDVYRDFRVIDFGDYRLEAEGTATSPARLWHNADAEQIILTQSTLNPSMLFNQHTTYNFGLSTTGNGNTRYSGGVGVIIQRGETVTQAEFRSNIHGGVHFAGGGAVWRGGIMLTDACMGFYGVGTGRSDPNPAILDILGTKIIKFGTTRRREIRIQTDESNGVLHIIVDGHQFTYRALPPDFEIDLRNGQISQIANGELYSLITNLKTADNLSEEADLLFDSQGEDDSGNRIFTAAKTIEALNTDSGSATEFMPKKGDTVGTARTLGIGLVTRDVEFQVIEDEGGANVTDAVVYNRDTDNGKRKNANGRDDTPDNTMFQSVVAGIARRKILVAVTNVDETGDFEFDEWDTNARFGVDRRGLTNIVRDDRFRFWTISYLYNPDPIVVGLGGTVAQPANGDEIVSRRLVYDSLITIKNVSIVRTYVDLNTPTKTYDFLKDWKRLNIENAEYLGVGVHPLPRVGQSLTSLKDLTISEFITDSFEYDDDNHYIKASTFIGDIDLTRPDALNDAGDLVPVAPFNLTLRAEVTGTVRAGDITAENHRISGDVYGTYKVRVPITLNGNYVEHLEIIGGDEGEGITLINGAEAATIENSTDHTLTITSTGSTIGTRIGDFEVLDSSLTANVPAGYNTNISIYSTLDGLLSGTDDALISGESTTWQYDSSQWAGETIYYKLTDALGLIIQTDVVVPSTVGDHTVNLIQTPLEVTAEIILSVVNGINDKLNDTSDNVDEALVHAKIAATNTQP